MLRINMRQIEIFNAVMISGGFKAASRQLSVSVPNVSKVIALLEQRLGFCLFHRSARGVRPTQEALLLYAQVKPICNRVRSLSEFAKCLRDTSSAQLRVVSTIAPSSSLVPMAIAELRRKFPAAKLTFQCLPMELLVAQLETGTADLGLSLFQPPGDDLAPRIIGSVPLVCVFRGVPHLSNKIWIEPHDIVAGPLISYIPGTPNHEQIRAWFADAGLAPDPSLFVCSGTSACSLIEQQPGVALVDACSAQSHCICGATARPVAPSLTFPLVLTRRAGVVPSPMAGVFERIVADIVEQHVLVPDSLLSATPPRTSAPAYADAMGSPRTTPTLTRPAPRSDSV